MSVKGERIQSPEQGVETAKFGESRQAFSRELIGRDFLLTYLKV